MTTAQLSRKLAKANKMAMELNILLWDLADEFEERGLMEHREGCAYAAISLNEIPTIF